MSRELLGTFELTVILSIIRLGDEGYGVAICEAIEAATQRPVVVASVYAALDRLERKGFVVSQLGESTAERGGRAKRYFRVTAEGLRQVREVKRGLTRLWRGLPELAGESV